VQKRLKVAAILTVKRWLSIRLRSACSLMSKSKEGGYLAAFLDSNKEGGYGKSHPYKPLRNI